MFSRVERKYAPIRDASRTNHVVRDPKVFTTGHRYGQPSLRNRSCNGLYGASLAGGNSAMRRLRKYTCDLPPPWICRPMTPSSGIEGSVST